MTTKKLYCFGGHSNDPGTVSYMNISTGEWQKTANMITPRKSFAGASTGSKVYLCGGQDNNHQHLSSMEMFDCETNIWTQLSPMPQTRWGCADAVLNGYVYVTGGCCVTSGQSEDLSSVIRYDIQTDQWETVASMNKQRWAHQLVELGSRLYAIGGCGQDSYTSVEEYNPSTDQWSLLASTNFEHYMFGAASHCGELYICSANGFEVYSPEVNIWTELTKLGEYWGQTLVSVDRKLLAIGGHLDDQENTASVFCYDFRSDEWTTMPDMDVARAGHFGCVLDR